MEQIIYLSRAAGPINETLLDAILVVARERNRADGVTGLLVHGHSYFLQMLEGSPAALNHTYHRIASDPRHQIVRILGRRPVTRRLCTSGSMGAFPSTEVDQLAAGDRVDANIVPHPALLGVPTFAERLIAGAIWSRPAP